METDEALFRLFLEGDENGLRELMERRGDALTLYINGCIHDIHEAEDLMIEAFARVVYKRPNLSEGCFKAYLYKTARHLALRCACVKKAHPAFSLENMDSEPECAALTETVAQTAERNRILRMCMTQLQPDYREALYLVFFEEMSYSQAASVMGKSEKQVDNLLQRGKKCLRTSLEKEGITYADVR